MGRAGRLIWGGRTAYAMDRARSRSIVTFVVLLLTLSPLCQGLEKIRVLATGHIDQLNRLFTFFRSEPLVEYVPVPSRATDVVTVQDAIKFIRLYFPRTYEEMGGYRMIMLAAPEYDLFSPKQDQWMYEAIRQGAGGINDGSVFSIMPQIHNAWANSQTSKAFPNDAPAVAQKGGGESGTMFFSVIINRNFPDPVLTPFVKFGIEKLAVNAVSRLVIPRQGSGTLAWQVGNFPSLGQVPFLIAWDYEGGRTMTTGDFLGNGWFSYPSGPASNQYSPDILMNMILYCTKRRLIEDVEVFHRVKSYFHEFRSRMSLLTSLRDFIDKFGANTDGIQREARKLEQIHAQGVEHYMNQDFSQCEGTMDAALKAFSEVEEMARRAKDAALLWVYVIEWLVASSTLFVSSFVLWTLMVKRRLYRAVRATRLGPG